MLPQRLHGGQADLGAANAEARDAANGVSTDRQKGVDMGMGKQTQALMVDAPNSSRHPKVVYDPRDDRRGAGETSAKPITATEICGRPGCGHNLLRAHYSKRYGGPGYCEVASCDCPEGLREPA